MPFRLPENHRPAARRFGRYGALAVTSTALVLGPALSAQAHVHVNPDTTTAGSTSTLQIRVPSESETASTTQLTLTLPPDHPFASVSVRSTPGWNAKVTTATLARPAIIDGTTLTRAAHTVTWTASDGASIPPEQYQSFELTVGPLPGSGELSFTALQKYSDGSSVAWDQPTIPGAAEPEHPAPSFAVTPAEPANSAASAGDSDSAATASGSDGLARFLGGAGLLAALGAIGLLVARRSPRPPRAIDVPAPGADAKPKVPAAG
jgi:uncharacterized protein YcnI